MALYFLVSFLVELVLHARAWRSNTTLAMLLQGSNPPTTAHSKHRQPARQYTA